MLNAVDGDNQIIFHYGVKHNFIALELHEKRQLPELHTFSNNMLYDAYQQGKDTNTTQNQKEIMK